MANVVNKPGWVGSSAVSVTGKRWMREAMQALKVGVPGNMSAMCGRGMDTVVATAAWSTSLGNNWGVTASNYPITDLVAPAVAVFSVVLQLVKLLISLQLALVNSGLWTHYGHS
ncbi:hypothetical protein ODS03_17730 [Escherichia coli]|nr:hypothetical protein [Escherichia coli]